MKLDNACKYLNLLFGLALQLIINFFSANVSEAQPAEASHPVAPVPTPRARKSKVGEAPPSPVSPSASVASNASADLISFTQPAAAAAADSSSSSSPLQQQSPSRVSLSGIAAGVPPATAAKPVQPPARPALPPMPRSVPPPMPATYKSPTSAPLAPQTKVNVVAAGSLARTVSVEEEVVPSAPPMPDYMTNEGMSLMQSPPVPQSAYPPVPLYPMPGFYPPPHTAPEAQHQLPMSQLPYPAEFAPTRPPPYPNASTASGTSSSSTSTSAVPAMSSSSNRTSASAMPSPPPYVERPQASSMYPPIPQGVSSTSAPTLPPSSAPAPNVVILQQQEHFGMYIREHFASTLFMLYFQKLILYLYIQIQF